MQKFLNSLAFPAISGNKYNLIYNSNPLFLPLTYLMIEMKIYECDQVEFHTSI